MRRLKFTYPIFQVVMVAVLLLGLTIPTLAQETIKIGVLTPLTGPVSTYGQSVRNAAVLGFNKINENGGINGKMIELIIVDDKGEATESANGARKLIDRDQVDLIFGPVVTPCVMAVAPIAQSAGIPMITPTGTGDTITEIGDFIFRAAYKDSFQGETMARHAVENLGVKTAAIIYDIANDYSNGLMQSFRKKFEELGGKVLTVQSYSTGDSDFSAQLTFISMYNPEAIFIPDYYSAAGPIILQTRQLGIDAQLLGVDGWDSPEFHALAGGFEDGSYMVNHYSPQDQSPTTQAFIKEYTKEFNQSPDALAALGYDAVLIVKAALEAAGSTDPEALKHALGTVQNIQGATGTINMDPEGTPIKAVVILRNNNGVWELSDKIEP